MVSGMFRLFCLLCEFNSAQIQIGFELIRLMRVSYLRKWMPQSGYSTILSDKSKKSPSQPVVVNWIWWVIVVTTEKHLSHKHTECKSPRVSCATRAREWKKHAHTHTRRTVIFDLWHRFNVLLRDYVVNFVSNYPPPLCKTSRKVMSNQIYRWQLSNHWLTTLNSCLPPMLHSVVGSCCPIFGSFALTRTRQNQWKLPWSINSARTPNINWKRKKIAPSLPLAMSRVGSM